MPNQTVKNSLKTKRIKLPQMKFFLEKQSFCKILIELIQSYENVQYAGTNGQFDLNKFFLVQTIIITFLYLLALFIVQNLQKILTADPNM